MKKILVITNMYPSKKYPHYGIFIQNTVNLLQEHGHEVHVVGLQKQDGRLHKLFAYLKFYRACLKEGYSGSYDVVYGHYVSHIRYPIKKIKEKHPELKLVLNVHGNDIIAEEEWMKKNEDRSAQILPLADVIVAPSSYFKKILMEKYQIPEAKITLYPSGGVNTKVMHPMDKTEAKERQGLSAAKSYLGFVSRIEAHKGWELFLEMAKRLTEEKDPREFIMVGNGDQMHEVKEMIKQMKLTDKVHLYPFLDQKKLACVYNSLDLFIFPTYRKSESLGLVGLEAMACGVPVIAADNYGPTSYIEDGSNGIFFKTRDVNDLIRCVKQMDQMTPKQKNDMIQQGLKTAQKYDTQNTAQDILKIFES